MDTPSEFGIEFPDSIDDKSKIQYLNGQSDFWATGASSMILPGREYKKIENPWCKLSSIIDVPCRQVMEIFK